MSAAENVQKQYAAIGRFVEAFESMVNEVRSVCIKMLQRRSEDWELLNIVFHHQSLTANPLFEIMRAMIAQILGDDSKRAAHNIDNADRDGFFGVLKGIADEYSDLVKMRNNLLHGTWFIGFADDNNPDAAKFFVNKFTASATGLKLIDLPVSVEELDKLTARCNTARTWIGMVEACFVFSKTGFKFKEHFRHDGKYWTLRLAGGTEKRLGEAMA